MKPRTLLLLIPLIALIPFLAGRAVSDDHFSHPHHSDDASTPMALAVATAVPQEDDYDHDHAAKQMGPNGGRLVTSTHPHYEFLVQDDRRLKITFLSDDGTAIAPGPSTVTAAGGDRQKPTRFTFSEIDGSLVSDLPLPDGSEVPLILMVKANASAQPVPERIIVNTEQCSSCESPEYSCICAHDHDDHDMDDKHEHKS